MHIAFTAISYCHCKVIGASQHGAFPSPVMMSSLSQQDVWEKLQEGGKGSGKGRNGTDGGWGGWEMDRSGLGMDMIGGTGTINILTSLFDLILWYAYMQTCPGYLAITVPSRPFCTIEAYLQVREQMFPQLEKT